MRRRRIGRKALGKGGKATGYEYKDYMMNVGDKIKGEQVCGGQGNGEGMGSGLHLLPGYLCSLGKSNPLH